MYNFKNIENKARKKWNKDKDKFVNSIEDDNKKKIFSFLEGPPTANAPPGLHHLEVRTFKDIINKFKYMQGFSVPRKGGWDTHGLPVEVQVEKKLGLNSKKDIIGFGEAKFIKECKESVFSNIKEWEELTKELAYLIDLKNPYKTLDNDYIESVWWSLKELYNKGFLYEGYKVVPFCPRCQTPLSSHEVSQGYKDVEDTSVYVAFKLKNSEGYILAWTTTPWTLPGNVALAVGKDIEYVKVQLADGDKLILGKEKLDLIKGDYKIIENFKGNKLEGLEYEQLFDIKELVNDKSQKVIIADFVTTEDGTGVVHTAGMYGEEDYFVCKEKGLPLVHTVDENGKFNSLFSKYEGRFVKSVEKEIIEDLKKKKLLFKTEKINHSYPFCWRCDSPLLYYAINSWFLEVTKIKNKMVNLNKKINWYPNHIKKGRFGMWLENTRDWSLSRFKSWGTPLPIWRCEECNEEKIIGSVKELKESSDKKFKEYDLHKPWIDKIIFDCKCGKKMKRVPDLIDAWYDSGSASFAQFHYPFENKKEFERRFPYDFIAEAIDQTRGWFYTLHAISSMLFGEIAYKNVICAGLLVDEKGEKMSKTKGNIIHPKEIIDEIGVDAVRLQFSISDPGNEKRFSVKMVRESVLPFLNVFDNTRNFYLQSNGEKNEGSNRKYVKINGKDYDKLEDKWILSKLNNLIKNVTKDLENYALDLGLNKIMDFVSNDFSRGYIKITRERDDVKKVLGEVLEKVSLLLAPYAPYISEDIFSEFENNSVHLSDWPKGNEKMINNKLEKEFEMVLEIIEKGLSERDIAKVGLRWPLAKAEITIDNKNFRKDKFPEGLKNIILNQLNIKDLKLIKKVGSKVKVKLDTEISKELEGEGYAREISRKVQAARKKAGFVKNDKIKLGIVVDEELLKLLENFNI